MLSPMKETMKLVTSIETVKTIDDDKNNEGTSDDKNIVITNERNHEVSNIN